MDQFERQFVRFSRKDIIILVALIVGALGAAAMAVWIGVFEVHPSAQIGPFQIK